MKEGGGHKTLFWPLFIFSVEPDWIIYTGCPKINFLKVNSYISTSFQSLKLILSWMIEVCKVPAIRISSENFFFAFFLHHLIEIELLTTKIYFLALANICFRSKNTKYWGDLIFWKKQIFFEISKIFCPILFFSFWK